MPPALEIVLVVLKFVAIGIGTASGLIGTVTETRKKSTGRLTASGKNIVGLIIASGVVAGIAQGIELYFKAKADRADQIYRRQEIEAFYSLSHPLGDLRVHVNVTYPVTTGIGGLDGSWLGRVRRSTSNSYAVLNEPANPLRPRPNDTAERREFRLLIDPEFDLTLNVVPTQLDGDGIHLRDHDANLMFRTVSQKAALLYVHFDEKKIDNQIDTLTSRVIDDQRIRSWLDLYGAELIIQLPETAPVGARIISCSLVFSTGARFARRQIVIVFTDADRRANPSNELLSNISYVHVLTQADLGPKPEL